MLEHAALIIAVLVIVLLLYLWGSQYMKNEELKRELSDAKARATIAEDRLDKTKEMLNDTKRQYNDAVQSAVDFEAKYFKEEEALKLAMKEVTRLDTLVDTIEEANSTFAAQVVELRQQVSNLTIDLQTAVNKASRYESQLLELEAKPNEPKVQSRQPNGKFAPKIANS